MDFRTQVKTAESAIKISHSTTYLTAGSCFAENIAGKLRNYLFNGASNPHGIIYNPVSIALSLTETASGKKYTQEDLLENRGRWYSMNHHGFFSDRDPEKCLTKINSSIEQARSYLKNCNAAIITPGTAWAYIHRKTSSIAANCHKIPQHEFTKRMLTVSEISAALLSSIKKIREINSSISFIFTVSPVRHWRDGAHENQLSKSALFLAINDIIAGTSGTGYFPSYEILMDELRDYRFYERDMIHPSQSAIDYIWEKFCQSHMNPDSISIMKEIDQLRKFISHRPLDPDPESIRLHNERIDMKTDEFISRHPDIDTSILKQDRGNI